ncbi:E3 ubiquitin-protein ligase MARCHF11-like [Hypomesus transpacificus]|uniref:E3 ubiquitin-protein ligase MARCHF11-like n=1 Tax=Hypomesus transpacificus TaxID=137520 RepID=UPI001F087235|nr:E3 ubiquitin-protein ligase MARCHF11-like [Hypomesus transpacificus]
MTVEDGEAGPVCQQTGCEPRGGADTEGHSQSAEKIHENIGHASHKSQNIVIGGTQSQNNVAKNGEEGTSDEKRSWEERKQTMDSNCSSECSILAASCRICFQGADQGDLLNPCRCDGSVRYTHQQCLFKWISERGCWTCELCSYRFDVIAIHMKRPGQWQAITITLVEKVQIVAVFLGSLFLVASISWLLWSALSLQAAWQRRDILFQICYAMYAFMDLVCIGLIVHEGAAVHNVLMRWRALNLHWDVQNYDKAADMEEAARAETALVPRTLWLPLAIMGSVGPLQPITQLGPPQLWAFLCLPPLTLCCPPLAARGTLSQDRDSEGVVTSV